MRWLRARFSTKSNMVSRSTGGKNEASSKSESSWYELLEKEAERERPGVESGGWFEDRASCSAMVGSSSWTISRLDGVRRWRGRLERRGGEPAAMACVSSVVPGNPSAGHGREGAQ